MKRAMALASLLGLVGLAAVAAPAGTPEPPRLRVEHEAQLGGVQVQGVALREISALAWDEAAQLLVAASDRGQLFQLRLSGTGAAWQVQAVAVQPLAAVRDAEALATRRTALGTVELWATGERAGAAHRLGLGAESTAVQPWPAALRSRDRVEAIAWHPEAGLLVAAQNPRPWLQELPGHWHALHAADGRSWGFEAAAVRSHLKAIELLPGHRVLVLERTEHPATGGAFRTHLRLLDLTRCGESVPCDARTLALTPALPDGPDNFEGLACADDGRCWIVSDSGPDRQGRTRLLQLRLEGWR